MMACAQRNFADIAICTCDLFLASLTFPRFRLPYVPDLDQTAVPSAASQSRPLHAQISIIDAFKDNTSEHSAKTDNESASHI